MGTKRPSCTLFDTLSNINTSDRKLQPGGRVSRDPSPRPAMTAQSDRETDCNREEDWRREREMEKMREKARYKDMDPRERHYERAPAPRVREGEREWRERERRLEDDRGRNGRPLSNLERGAEREEERGLKKGDTFPRMRKSSAERDRRMMPTTEIDEEKGERRQRDRWGRKETDDWEREREKAWQRERNRDDIQSRGKEEGNKGGGRPIQEEKLRQRERYQAFDACSQGRGREVGDSRDRRERDATRKREKPRPNMGERGSMMPFSHQRRDQETYSDRNENEEGRRRERRRDTRSEGDSDERELRRERVRDREREEVIYQHSRSEGDDKGNRARERDRNRQGCRDEDRQRYRERDREREVDRSRRKGGEKDRERYRETDRRVVRGADRERERWRGDGRDFGDDRVRPNDRREDDRHREYEQRRNRERKGREADTRWDETTDRSSRSLSKTAPRVPPRSQSSGEWSSDMDSETRYRRGRDSYEEWESGRESTTESERDVEEQRDPGLAAERSRKEQRRSERQERDRAEMKGSMPEQRRMWLEPQRGKNSKEEFGDRERHARRKERRTDEERGMNSRAEWGREGPRVREEADERHSDHRPRHAGRSEGEHSGDAERETEGVSVDGEDVGEVWREPDKRGKEHLSDGNGGTEGSWRRDAEGESMTDNTEESDREEEGGRDRSARSERERGSESDLKQERNSLLSIEDGFVTVSSGGDEEDEREDDEDEEFEDCQEFWEGVRGGPSPAGFKGREGDEERAEGWAAGKEEAVDEEEQGKQPKYVFCVIGQTLPRSKPGDASPSQVVGSHGAERANPNLERCCQEGHDATRQPQDDRRPTASGSGLRANDRDAEGEGERRTPGEQRDATGETTEAEVRHGASSDSQDTEAGEGMRNKAERPHAEMGQISRDSQTERLLLEWREKNKELGEREGEQPSPVPGNPYAGVCSDAGLEQLRPILDGISAGAMSPEEAEAIRIRLSGAWSMSEEPKRHSQAPHLKWAKSVVREILGHSEEQALDEPAPGEQGGRAARPPEAEDDGRRGEARRGSAEVPVADGQHSEPEPEPEEEEPLLEVEGLRGMGRSRADMHADQAAAMHGDTPTHTHADTPLGTQGEEDRGADGGAEPSGPRRLGSADVEVTVTQEEGGEVALAEARGEESREREVEMYLSVSNTLYKPSSCPILNYESDSDLLAPSREEGERTGESEEGGQGGEPQEEEEEEEEGGEGEDEGVEEEVEGGEGEANAGEVVETRAGDEAGVDGGEGEAPAAGGTLAGTCSFRDLGPKARIRRRGIRKTTERRNGEHVEVEEEEGVGRDRRTRIFSTTDDDEDDRSKSWGEVELRNVLDTLEKRKRNSRFFNAAQLYQQYSEAAQNFEILRQSCSDGLSVSEDNAASPAPSPPPARRPLPPVPHAHPLSHTSSITSVRSLPLPAPPKSEGRPSSSRLSISLTQSATLWRDLPGVRNSGELEELTEDQRRLQEVRFEVVTSEASYCRSLDIVVEHFVKSKQLGALLATQDRNWLFSRLADVRAISHSFLSKLEERLESHIMHFTVCDIIAQYCQRFKIVYVPYLTNQSYQDATYQRLMNENPGFKRTVEKLERSPVCQRLPLRSFLVLPFQRITRIKLLVQNIVKRTTPGTVEATQAIRAMKLLEKLIQESNDSISQMKSIESLVSLSAKVDFECRTLPLISQSRRLVREGPVTELMDFSLKDTERNVYLHLFNDYLLLSQQKEGGRFTVIDHSPVSDLRVENCRVKLHSLQKNLFRLHMTHKSLLLRTDTQSDKLRWISALSQPPPEIDFSAAQDFPQMQCIRAFVAQQPDELSLEKADVILVHQQSSDHWVEGTRLSDRHHGWVPEAHLETITNSRVRQRNLSDALKLTTATAAV